MTTYLDNLRPTPRSLPKTVNDRHGRGLVALAAGAVLTCAALGIAAAAPSSESSHPTTSSRAVGTVESQTGTVTAVSPTSITVRSADGSSKSYAVNAGTAVDCKHNGITAVKVGDPVAVTATVTAGTANATDIVDNGAGAPVLSRMFLRASPLVSPFRDCLSLGGAPFAP